MTSDTDNIFRPWDTASPEKKPSKQSSPQEPRQKFNNNKSLAQPRLIVPKTEPGLVHSNPLHPLAIAMRGLLPEQGHSPSMTPPHLLQFPGVHHIHELQLAVSAVTAAASAEKKTVRPKKYKCEFCNACFSNNGQLRGHIRIHTGERPYSCSFPNCGKSFTRNEELTRHKRIHTGVKPFSCPLPGCGKPFGRKDHLKKHMKTHERFCSPIVGFPSPLSSLIQHQQSLALGRTSWL